MKEDYIRSRIKNLKERLEWQEEDSEKSRLALIKRANECTVKQIATGWLESNISEISREYEEIKSLRDQIELLEHILKNAE